MENCNCCFTDYLAKCETDIVLNIILPAYMNYKWVITDKFGTHEHATIKGFEVNNNGVDISTTKSSACRSLFAGEVTGVVNVPGSGKVVIIRHGEYLSVYTNLEDVNVKQGDKIAIKQSIGTVSFNDDESRSVMNLQIWKGQKILNPEDWLYR